MTNFKMLAEDCSTVTLTGASDVVHLMLSNVDVMTEAREERTVAISKVEANSSSKYFVPATQPSADFNHALLMGELTDRYHQCLRDLKSMRRMELAKKYPAEYNSHRARKQQAKSHHIAFDNQLKDFRDWLAHLGPRPNEGDTVDRINPKKGYSPKNLRWANKLVQTRNRSVTRWHELPNGTRVTTMQLCRLTGLTYNTLYKQLQRGKAIDEIAACIVKGVKGWKFPQQLRSLEPEFQGRKNHSVCRLEWVISHFETLLTTATADRRHKLMAARDSLINERRGLELEEQARKEAYVDRLLSAFPTEEKAQEKITQVPQLAETHVLNHSELIEVDAEDAPPTPEEMAAITRKAGIVVSMEQLEKQYGKNRAIRAKMTIRVHPSPACEKHQEDVATHNHVCTVE